MTSSKRVGVRSVVACIVAAGACFSAATGCSSTPQEPAGESTAALVTVAESSYVSDAVIGVLAASPEMKGRTWNVTHDNSFGDDWLVETPATPLWGQPASALVYPKKCTANCDADFALKLCATDADCTEGGVCKVVQASVNADGGTPKSMCVGHSDALVDRIYGMITSAEKFVDITTLTPADGRYAAAIRNAITRLSTRPNPPQVRILTAEYPFEGRVNTKSQAQSFTRDISARSPIRVAVGAFRSSDLPPSWNHAKIIAIDGKIALVGGHNMWTQQYLMQDPVHDVSMVVRGSAAGDAHRFANELWDYTCKHKTLLTFLDWSVWDTQFENGALTSNCPEPYSLPAVEGAPTGTVISVGRLGAGIVSTGNDKGNQADAARIALFDAAKSTIRITQQDIGPTAIPKVTIPLTGWPTDELAALARAVARGVDVYVILSDLNASAGGLPITQATYANGWKPEEIGRHVRTYMQQNPGFPQGAQLDALLCQKLHLTTFRYGPVDNAWPSGVPFALHGKQIAIDEQALYITSHNMYPAELQEFGYIVDDSQVTADWSRTYWANAWQNSVRAAVMGSEVTHCGL